MHPLLARMRTGSITTHSPHSNECVDTEEGPSGNVVEHNLFTGLLDRKSAGLAACDSGNTFRHTIVYGNHGAGISLGRDHGEDDDGTGSSSYPNIHYDNAVGSRAGSRVLSCLSSPCSARLKLRLRTTSDRLLRFPAHDLFGCVFRGLKSVRYRISSSTMRCSSFRRTPPSPEPRLLSSGPEKAVINALQSAPAVRSLRCDHIDPPDVRCRPHRGRCHIELRSGAVHRRQYSPADARPPSGYRLTRWPSSRRLCPLP